MSRLILQRKSEFSTDEFETSPIYTQEPDFTNEETLKRMKELIPAESFAAIDISKPPIEIGEFMMRIGHQVIDLNEDNEHEMYIVRNFAAETSITVSFRANTVLYGLRYLLKTTTFKTDGIAALRLHFGMILPSKEEQLHTVYLDFSKLPKLDEEGYHKFYLELGTDDGRQFADRAFKLSLKDVQGIKGEDDHVADE